MPNAASGSMLKLAMVGDGGVGKTALVIQLCLNKFVETYDPTIEDSYRKRILLDDHATTLELMDTAGQEEYVGLRDQWIREGEGFLLVYSVTQKMSFTRIKQYYNEISRMRDGEPFGAVLVGNKIDQVRERQVSTQEGEQLAHSWGIPFFETSAKMNINAEMTFLSLARLTRDKRNELSEIPDANVSPNGTPNALPVGITPAVAGGAPSELRSGSHAGPANELSRSKQSTPDAHPAVPVGPVSTGAQVNAQPYSAQAVPVAGPNGSSDAVASSESHESAKKDRKKKSKKGKCVVM